MKQLLLSTLLLMLLSFSAGAENVSDHSAEKVSSLSTITVISKRMTEYVRNHPQNIVILNRKEISERNFMEVGEALGSMPGVDIKHSGSSSGYKISVRGSGGSGKVLVLINGRPVNSSQYGGVNLDSIPIEIVDKVMVFKPPVPVWLGPGATAGAVNIITSAPVKNGSKKDKLKKRLKVSGGSNGKMESTCFIALPFREKGNIMATAGCSHIDGKRLNSDRDTGRFCFQLDNKTDSLFQYDLNARYFHSLHGSSGPSDNLTPDARQRYQKGAFDLNLKGFIGKVGDLSIKSYADITDLEDISQNSGKSKLKVYKYGMKSDMNWSEEEGGWALRLGGLLEKNDINHNRSGIHHREKVSMYTQGDRCLDDLTISMGLRGDYTNDFNFLPAYTIGLSYAFGKELILKSNCGYSTKTPTFSQLYQPSHGSIDQVRGNENLDEEKIYSYDIVLEHRPCNNINFEASLFRTDTKDLILYKRNETDLVYEPININKAYRQGAEVAIKINIKDLAELNLNYIFQKSKISETGNELNYVPKNKFKATMIFSLETATRVEIIFKALSHQYSGPENKRSEIIDSYACMDMKIIQPLSFISMPADFFVHFNNIFDTDFEFHHGYPDDGFRFICGLNLTF